MNRNICFTFYFARLEKKYCQVWLVALALVEAAEPLCLNQLLWFKWDWAKRQFHSNCFIGMTSVTSFAKRHDATRDLRDSTCQNDFCLKVSAIWFFILQWLVLELDFDLCSWSLEVQINNLGNGGVTLCQLCRWEIRESFVFSSENWQRSNNKAFSSV